ncbi:MAG TPA: zinc-ribbon domain-containing protein [Ktedonobacteraceae bacterium]|nr:zinc-ribbon domain-containing protein [Ktedonobacteraceae bacterium]
MVFCGQCGYQLSPGDKICPRCGAETNADMVDSDPGTYNPTVISHTVPENFQAPPRGRSSQSRPSMPPAQEPPRPLVLGPSSVDDQLANETTTMMNSQMMNPQMYAQQPGYQNHPQQMNTGFYGYNAGGYQQAQSGQFAALMESSRRGQTTALLLILFGLLLLIAAIIILLLTLQGTIFTA